MSFRYERVVDLLDVSIDKILSATTRIAVNGTSAAFALLHLERSIAVGVLYAGTEFPHLICLSITEHMFQKQQRAKADEPNETTCVHDL